MPIILLGIGLGFGVAARQGLAPVAGPGMPTVVFVWLFTIAGAFVIGRRYRYQSQSQMQAQVQEQVQQQTLELHLHQQEMAGAAASEAGRPAPLEWVSQAPSLDQSSAKREQQIAAVLANPGFGRGLPVESDSSRRQREDEAGVEIVTNFLRETVCPSNRGQTAQQMTRTGSDGATPDP
jgi:hypothetical protein